MYDILFVGRDTEDFQKLKIRFPLIKRAGSFIEARTKAYTRMFWIIWGDVLVNEDFMFDYVVSQWDEQYVHVFKNGKNYDGIALFPKRLEISQKEIENRIYYSMKEVDIQASEPKVFDIFSVDSYEEYVTAVEESSTEMFWMTSKNLRAHKDFEFSLYFEHSNTEDRKQNHVFLHKSLDVETYSGIILCSKYNLLTKNEVEKRFPLKRREWPIIASVPVSYSKTIFKWGYDEYLEIMKNRSTTELIWFVPDDVVLDQNFDFDFYFSHENEFDRKINHVFLNDKSYDGVMLLSKHSIISEREFKHRFLIEKKEWNIVASSPRKFDIFYIDTYEEYEQALNQTTTEMFWMTSRNLQPLDNFKFDFYITHHNRVDREQNHAFIHRVRDKDSYNGIFLLSKHKLLGRREIEYRFPVERKEWDIVASGPVRYEKYVFN